MAGKGTLTVKILGDDSHLQRTVGSVGSGLGKIGATALKAGALLGGAGLAGGFAAAVTEAREAAKIGRLTDAVIKSTGGAAKVTAEQVGNYAEKLSNLTGIDDEAIQGGQNLLLTFTKVRNEVGEGNNVFDRATEAALNMSVAMGTDMNGAALQMGKALNDPIKGMAALSRAGVSFTAQQKEQVKAMVEAGDVLGAQKIILGEMETQFGGAAAAAADPLQKLTTIAGNLMEKLGTALLPVIETVATWLGENLPPAIDKAGQFFSDMQPKIQAVVSFFKDTVMPVIQGVVDKVVGLFRDKLGPQVDGTSSKVTTIIGGLRDTFRSIFDAIYAIVDTTVRLVLEMWDRFGRGLVDNIAAAFVAVGTVVSGALTVLSGVFDLIKAVLTGKWGAAWDALKKIVGGAWEVIKGIIGLQIAAIRIAIETALGLISMVWSGAWNGLKTLVSDIWEGIKTAVRSGVDWVLDKVNTALGPLQRVVDLAGRIPGTSGSILNTSQRQAIQNPPKPSNSRKRAAGGPVWPGTDFLVGENGPELVRFGASGNVTPNHKMGGTSSTITVRGIKAKDIFTGQQILDLLRDVERTSGPLKLKIAN